ncbi:MAG: hypothetical protein M3P70_15125 [Actinomycetota bacterium]|nr:hypothetical protein [Actinomycetota bacterium]
MKEATRRERGPSLRDVVLRVLLGRGDDLYHAAGGAADKVPLPGREVLHRLKNLSPFGLEPLVLALDAWDLEVEQQRRGRPPETRGDSLVVVRDDRQLVGFVPAVDEARVPVAPEPLL